jgi:DNA-binding MarR family transcriptional regulator
LGAKQLSTPLLQVIALLTSLEPPAGTYASYQVSRKRLEGVTSLAPVLLRTCVLYAMLPGNGRYATATELAWATALPRSTTVKILNTLAALELIERAPNANNFRLPA